MQILEGRTKNMVDFTPIKTTLKNILLAMPWLLLYAGTHGCEELKGSGKYSCLIRRWWSMTQSSTPLSRFFEYQCDLCQYCSKTGIMSAALSLRQGNLEKLLKLLPP
jgi:hypothetical protein